MPETLYQNCNFGRSDRVGSLCTAGVLCEESWHLISSVRVSLIIESWSFISILNFGLTVSLYSSRLDVVMACCGCDTETRDAQADSILSSASNALASLHTSPKDTVGFLRT